MLFGLAAPIEQRIQARRRRAARTHQAIAGLGDDPLQSRQGFCQRAVLCIFLAAGGAELSVYQLEKSDQIGGFGELDQERFECFERFLQLIEVLFGQKEERLRAHHLQITFVENACEEIALKFELGAKAFDELAVLLHRLALHDDNQIVLDWKFLFELHVDMVVLLFATDQIVAAGVELQFFNRKKDADQRQDDLRVKEPASLAKNGVRQPQQKTRGR